MASFSLVVVLLLASASVTMGYYLPGVDMKTFNATEAVVVYASKLSSDVTQIPYKYYDLNFCHPDRDLNRYSQENYGMAISGIYLEKTDMTTSLANEKQCQLLCGKPNKSSDNKLFRWFIDQNYRSNFIMDNMPAVQVHRDHSIEKGILVGHRTQAGYHLNNHYQIKVLYHKESGEENLKDQFGDWNPNFRYSIIGLHVVPWAIDYGEESSQDEVIEICNSIFVTKSASDPASFTERENLRKKIYYTYNLIYEETRVPWSERWVEYLQSGNQESYIHWMSILNSCMVVVFLSGIVAHILSRTLNQDIEEYNTVNTDDEFEDASGWKQLQGDVFRPPRRSMLLSALLGNGIHLLVMTLVTVILAGIGFLSPARRGALLTSVIYLFVLTSNIAGFVSARFYKMMNGPKWFKTTLLTAFGYSGVLFGVFFLLNFVLHLEGSSGAVSFTNLLTLLCLWFLVSTPFTFLGGLVGYKRDQIENPTRVNKIPRPVPQQKWYLRSKMTILAGGLLPFISIFIELYFIMSSVWGAQIYYMFGLMFLATIILILTCAEISIVICYLQLSKEDYRWWWRSFLTAGATGLYLFGFSMLYFFFSWETTRLSSAILFFGYMFLASVTLFVMTGTVGFISTYIFVRKIYTLVKLDQDLSV